MSTLDTNFTAVVEKGPGTGGSTYMVVPDPAQYFVDGQPFRSSFLALVDGRRKLAVRAGVQEQIGKHAGDTVTIHLDERIPPTSRRSTR